MDHNQIEFIHPEAFRGLTSLRLLHLEGNLLRQLHPATFSTFAFLDYFRLSTVRHLYHFQMFKLDLEKAEETEIKLPISVGS